jgi:hypothetical protein
MKHLILWVTIVVALASCGQEVAIKNKFDDNVILRIYDFKDRRLVDSLYQFFSDPNPIYRAEAALAFGSIQDSTALDKLAKLLKDESSDVRTAVAFSIGQTPSWNSADYLLQSLLIEADDVVRDEIFEAIGKTIRTDQLKSFLENEFPPTRGISWCLYQIGRRGMADSLAVAKSATMLDKKLSVRIIVGAAFFFRM